jgi:hypothetical protein
MILGNIAGEGACFRNLKTQLKFWKRPGFMELRFESKAELTASTSRLICI